jgi:hypothetical protein
MLYIETTGTILNRNRFDLGFQRYVPVVSVDICIDDRVGGILRSIHVESIHGLQGSLSKKKIWSVFTLSLKQHAVENVSERRKSARRI